MTLKLASEFILDSGLDESLSLELPAWSDVDGLEIDREVLAELRYAS